MEFNNFNCPYMMNFLYYPFLMNMFTHNHMDYIWVKAVTLEELID